MITLSEATISMFQAVFAKRGLEMNDKQGSLDLERRRNRTVTCLVGQGSSRDKPTCSSEVLLTTGAATKTSISEPLLHGPAVAFDLLCWDL